MGRIAVIPANFVQAITQRYKSGEGFRALSNYLKRCGIDASPASCRRAMMGLPPYEYPLDSTSNIRGDQYMR